MVDFTKNKKGDVVAAHCCDSCARAAGLTPKTPAGSGKASWFCEVCGHHGMGSLTDCEIGDWLRLRPMQPNEELADEAYEAGAAAAGGIAGRLGQILAGTEASGLTVVDGRLAELVDGEAMDFERRRSDGQRIRAALRVAAKAYRGQVVPLDGRYWLALDDAARAEFGAIAAELGLYVLTERPTEGHLRVDHVRGEEAW